MRMTHSGRSFLAREEGVILLTYRDSVGVLTLGIGHTAAAGAPAPKAGMKITLDEAMAIFARDLKRYEDRVASLVTVPLSPNEFDALVSFDFNTGGLRYKSSKTGKLTDSSLLKAVNGKKGADAIRAGFLAWSRAGSNPSALKGRRLREASVFLEANYGAIATVPVSDVWPPRYKQMPLPADAPEAAVPPPMPRPRSTTAEPEAVDEAADAVPEAPPAAYNPEVDGAAVAEPPKPVSQMTTIWAAGGGATTAVGTILSFVQNIYGAIAVVVIVVAAAWIINERLKRERA